METIINFIFVTLMNRTLTLRVSGGEEKSTDGIGRNNEG